MSTNATLLLENPLLLAFRLWLSYKYIVLQSRKHAAQMELIMVLCMYDCPELLVVVWTCCVVVRHAYNEQLYMVCIMLLVAVLNMVVYLVDIELNVHRQYLAQCHKVLVFVYGACDWLATESKTTAALMIVFISMLL
jgi:hypothetical protein